MYFHVARSLLRSHMRKSANFLMHGSNLSWPDAFRDTNNNSRETRIQVCPVKVPCFTDWVTAAPSF